MVKCLQGCNQRRVRSVVGLILPSGKHDPLIVQSAVRLRRAVELVQDVGGTVTAFPRGFAAPGKNYLLF